MVYNKLPVMKNIAILCKVGDDPMTVLSELVPWLGSRGYRVLLEPGVARARGMDEYAEDDMPATADMAIVLGGDGTMLRAAREFDGHPVPLLGVNLGGLGFITEVNREEVFEALEYVLSGDCPREDRMRIIADVKREGMSVETATALNDVVIAKGSLARLIEIEATVGGAFVNSFRADGVILSTPTGSTAYSLSAGGPIVRPLLECMVLTPICPHTLTNRPIVLPADESVSLRLVSSGDDALLTIDGQAGVGLRQDDVVEVRRSPHKTTFLMPSKRDYFQVLRSKLKWGERLPLCH
jgi:NAD+ kinase